MKAPRKRAFFWWSWKYGLLTKQHKLYHTKENIHIVFSMVLFDTNKTNGARYMLSNKFISMMLITFLTTFSYANTVTATTSSPAISIVAPDQSERIIPVEPAGILSITVKNDSKSSYNANNANNANNVKIVLPDAWTKDNAVQQSNEGCDSIPPGGTCVINLTATRPFVAEGSITIEGDNTAYPAPETAIAFRAGGGLVFETNLAGEMAKSITEVDVPTDGKKLTWGSTEWVGADSLVNGVDNTDKIIVKFSNQESAANQCRQYTDGTHDNWYLPALCELGSANFFLCIEAGSPENVEKNLANLGFGHLNQVGTKYHGLYWTSTDWVPYGERPDAQIVDFSKPRKIGSSPTWKKDRLGPSVRCMRTFHL